MKDLKKEFCLKKYFENIAKKSNSLNSTNCYQPHSSSYIKFRTAKKLEYFFCLNCIRYVTREVQRNNRFYMQRANRGQQMNKHSLDKLNTLREIRQLSAGLTVTRQVRFINEACPSSSICEQCAQLFHQEIADKTD